ncbi:hypothetical protein [Actinomadura meridiana]
MVVDHSEPDPLHPLAALLTALAATTLICLAIFAFLIWEWAAWSYEYRQGSSFRMPIKWGPRWDDVRHALERAGIDIDTIAAYKTFDEHANLQELHPPRRSLGISGVFSDWGARHTKKLIIVGAACGVTLSVADELWPDWYDRPAFWIAIGIATAAIAPFAARNGWSQYRQNARLPDSVVIIPTQWPASLRRQDPTAMAVFMHELSHVRHHDAARRRIISVYTRFGQFFAFLDAGIVLNANLPTWLSLAAFLTMATTGILGVRRARPALILIEELRADAEACSTPETQKGMCTFLDKTPPTPQTKARKQTLTTNWSPTALKSPTQTITTTTLGFALPVLLLTPLLWTNDTAPQSPPNSNTQMHK